MTEAPGINIHLGGSDPEMHVNATPSQTDSSVVDCGGVVLSTSPFALPPLHFVLVGELDLASFLQTDTLVYFHL